MKLSSSARVFLRGLQLIASVVALGTIAGSFITITNYDRSLILGSEATNLGMLSAYTAVLYALYQTTAEATSLVPAFTRKAGASLDFITAVLLLIAGITLATAEYVTSCTDMYQEFLRCGTLKTGMAFVFVSCVLFILTAVLNAPDVGEDREDIAGFVEQSTPKGSTTTDVSCQV